MSVFVDTSALIALMVADDEFFKDSCKILSELINKKIIIVSSNYVLLETHTILRNRIGIESVRVLKDDILPIIKTYWINEEIHDFGVRVLLASGHKKISLVDHISFEVMRRLNIKQAFTFDDHFKQMGFEILKA